MKTTRKDEFAKSQNPFVRFSRGLGKVVHDYHELRDDARRRYPSAFR